MLIALLVVLAFTSTAAQTLRFSPPVEGVLGKDYFIVNHVDHDAREGAIRDHACGIQTYDGHDGTDFVLRSFRQMDSGVYVLSAADGVVITVVDSLPDRNKQSVIEREFGNVIAVRHPQGYISYYAHIRRNSARVVVGDVVKRGARIALVGSSGNSSDPHVHFEVWQRIDPFSGNCADSTSHWSDQPDYTTEYKLIDADVTTWPPLLDTLRERPPHADVQLKDSTVTFWSLQQGIAATDALEVEWLTPVGTSWFRYQTTTGVASHYFYWWSYILRPSEVGTWTVVQRVNGVESARVKFTVSGTTTAPDTDSTGSPVMIVKDNRVVTSPPALTISVFTLDGRLVASSQDGTVALPYTFTKVLRAVFLGGRTVTMIVQ